MGHKWRIRLIDVSTRTTVIRTGDTCERVAEILGPPQYYDDENALWFHGRLRLRFRGGLRNYDAPVILVTLSLHPWCRPHELDGLLAGAAFDGSARAVSAASVPERAPAKPSALLKPRRSSVH